MANLVPTVRLSRKSVDNRQDRRQPIAKVGMLFDFPDTVNTLTVLNKRLNGFVTGYLIASPAIPTDATFTLSISEVGTTFNVYTNATLADTTTEAQDLIAINLYLAGLYDITINFTTALSGDTAEFDLELLLSNSR